jgi:branched-chain amino acid transport system permease protein
LYYVFGNIEFLGKYDGLNGMPPITVFNIALDNRRSMYALIWLAVLLALFSVQNLLNFRPGRAIRAIRSGSTMPQAIGVNTAWMKVVIFRHAALLASLSGWLYAHLQRAMNPTPFSLRHGIEYLFMAVIGGAAHVWGAVLGAATLTILKDVPQGLLPKLLGSEGNFEIIVFGVLLVVLLQYACDGLWPLIRKRFPATLPAQAPDIAQALPQKDKPAVGDTILEVDGVVKKFGDLTAVNGVSFRVRAGEIVGRIGPNGAGKSTTFNLVTGVLPVSGGQIHYRGESVTSLTSRKIVRRGVARTFQHVQLLPMMTVLENVALGAHLYDEAGSLALGQQCILEIARALCCDPALRLLDEPAAGLRYKKKQAFADLLNKLRAEGMAILLAEHDMDFVMNLTDHIVVMEFGIKIAEGTPEQIQSDPAVLQAYLDGIAA